MKNVFIFMKHGHSLFGQHFLPFCINLFVRKNFLVDSDVYLMNAEVVAIINRSSLNNNHCISKCYISYTINKQFSFQHEQLI